MAGPTPSPARPGLLGRAATALAAVAGVVLALLVALIAASVFARYALGSPLLGVNEVVQLGAVALVMLALPYCTSEGAHVRADVFDPFIGRWGRFGGDVLSRSLSVLALVVLVWRAWGKMLDAWEFGDATNMLGWPIWPAYALICAGMALAALILALEAGAILIGRGEAAE